MSSSQFVLCSNLTEVELTFLSVVHNASNIRTSKKTKIRYSHDTSRVAEVYTSTVSYISLATSCRVISFINKDLVSFAPRPNQFHYYFLQIHLRPMRGSLPVVAHGPRSIHPFAVLTFLPMYICTSQHAGFAHRKA
jgi:hypothetical protein